MELEAKFAVPDAAIAKQLKTVEMIDSFVLNDGKTARVRDTYLDTRDRRLLAAGFECRRRVQDGQILITVKQMNPTGEVIHAREELEITLDKYVPPAQWKDSPARDCVLGIVGDEPLRTLLTLQQTRFKREVMKDGNTIAELSVDEVRVRAANKVLNLIELEIELTQGTEHDLANLAAQVQERWGLAPEAQSKFQRALAWVDQAKSKRKKRTATKKSRRRSISAITLDDAMAEAARKTLLLNWARMLDHEAGARAGNDAERVHDMRVATRRMRAALRVFDAFLNANAFKPFAKMLRRTARALGAVRDLDVFRENTQHYLDALPTERKAELDKLLGAWQAEHEHARTELTQLLDSDGFVRFKTEFDEFLRTPGAGAAPIETRDGEPIAHRVRDVLPTILLRSYAGVRAYDELVSVSDVPVTRLHQLRISSKGLRYTLEFFVDVLSPEAQALIDAVKRLQDHLGTLQDAVVACDNLRDFLTWGEWSQAAQKSSRRPRSLVVAPGVATYLAARQSDVHALVQSFPRVWAPIVDAEFKRRLLDLIAAW